MNFKSLLLSLMIVLTTISSINAEKLPTKSKFREPTKDLYAAFQHPDKKYHPYVRWWWNGVRLSEKEILRELDLLNKAGIGGVEINSIKFPKEADSLGYRVMPYLSDDWARMIRVAADGCKERGMVCDMIGGSGWPFGGEFLPKDKQLQMLTIQTMDVDGGANGAPVSLNREDLLNNLNPPIMSKNANPTKELKYIRLMPKKVDAFTEGISYNDLVKNETISINVPPGRHVLYFFVKFTGYMDVIEGAPGAGGPVLNHLDKTAVQFYLDRLSDKIQFNSPSMKGKIRAAFVDSFELEGANWNDDFLDAFQRRFGYSLTPYLPYIIRKIGSMGDPLNEVYGCEFSPEITKNIIDRIRSDFEHFQIELFHDNFIVTLNNWCHANGLKSRVQCYGRGLSPVESPMYIDIPECETWMRNDLGLAMDDNSTQKTRYNLTGRAHSFINKFVASASLLAGNGMVSCEEQTNVGLIYQTTLEETKVAGDMSNISGVNQSVLHGFNYSPQEAKYPGWIKYGTFFSEHNPFWQYYPLWFEYKARLSAVLQNSIPQSDIALLPPVEDMWSDVGQQRDPYDVWYPSYAKILWESLHQNGNGCDYVSENVIQQSSVKGGKLFFGPRTYKTLILMSVESLDPKTAQKIAQYVSQGGKVICIGKTPHKSFGFKDAAIRDSEVKTTIERIAKEFPSRFINIDAPETTSMTEWYRGVQQRLGITPYIKIEKPNKWLIQNYYKSGDKDLFFMTNFSITDHQTMNVEFPAALKNKHAWLWDAETGKRYMLPYEGSKLNLDFGPAESKLIVFDNNSNGEMFSPLASVKNNAQIVSGLWKVKAVHLDKSVKEFEIDSLQDFNTLPIPWLRHFAGEIYYTTNVNVENPEAITILDAGVTHLGVTELQLNGETIGVKWYGDRRFNVAGKLHKGANTVTIKVTTLIGNYNKSLTENRTAHKFAGVKDYRPLGLEGPVKIY